VASVAVPFAFDQPNNACRLEELGVAELVKPQARSATSLARALERLLAGSAIARARELGARMRSEDGVTAACAILEQTFGPGR
jgi:UDP:flavonoid glycosyltransferase YjiC (YdhE family)